METYTMKPEYSAGEGKVRYITIREIFNGEMTMRMPCEVFATSRPEVRECAKASLEVAYGYSTHDCPNSKEVVWSLANPDALSSALQAQLRGMGYRPMVYANGGYFSVKFNPKRFHYPLHEKMEQRFVIFEGDNGIEVVHPMDIDTPHRKAAPRMDIIWGLSEFQHRVNNLQNNSVLVISYRGDEYQTREYVITNAIRKGFNTADLKALIDLLSTGRVVFAGMSELFVGTISYEPRNMGFADLIRYEMDAGRDPEIGARIAEAAYPFLNMYLEWLDTQDPMIIDSRPVYRLDENLCPIPKLR